MCSKAKLITENEKHDTPIKFSNVIYIMLTNSTAIYLLPDTFNVFSHELFSNLIVNNVPIRHFK